MGKSSKLSLSRFSRLPLAIEEQTAARAELLEGTDRSSALIGCALVDTTLVSAIATRLVAMTEREFEAFFYSSEGPCASFAARIKLGKAIGIYGQKVTTMLDSIRRVRNAFAHCVKPLRFDNGLICNECAKLPDAKLGKLFNSLPKALNPERERYIAVCLNLVIILEDHAKRHAGRSITVDIPDN